MSDSKKVLFSGVQPTGGGMMLGNYIGAVKNWVRLQEDYECLYCVVDLHAITMRHEPNRLRDLSYELLATYIAAGLDPQKNLLFIQSHVPQHAELAWILGCYTYMGELSRMTQFKDKSGKGQNIGVGLFTYPALMAADILLYQAHLVPVGQDQKQHLELTRDLAIRLNNLYGRLFQVPDIYIPPVGARIMSLADPTAKMSKSDSDPNATVFFSDSDEAILKKFKKAVTDSVGVVNFSDDQPGVKNLITIQSALTGQSPEDIVKAYEGRQYGPLKTETAELVIQSMKPIREEYQRLLKDRGHLDQILKRNADKARAKADQTLRRVHEALGFIGRT